MQRPSSGMSSVSSRTNEDGHTRGGPYIEGNLKLLETIDCEKDVLCCRFNHNGQMLAVGLTDGTIKIYNIPHHAVGHQTTQTAQLVHTLTDEDTVKTRLPVTQIRFRIFSQDDKIEHSHYLIASYVSGDVKVWHYTSGECLYTIHECRQTLGLALNPNGKKFLTTGNDSQIHLYDEETKKKINTLEGGDSKTKMDGHRQRVFTAQYHIGDPHVFITGGWDDTVQFWDEREIHSKRYFAGPHICGDSLDIDAQRNHILTGSWRTQQSLQIWNFSDGRIIKNVPPEPMNDSMVYCCQWLGKDSILAGGTHNNLVRIIDRGTLNTTGQLVDLPQGVFALDNDKQGTHPQIAVGSGRNIYLIRSEKRSN